MYMFESLDTYSQPQCCPMLQIKQNRSVRKSLQGVFFFLVYNKPITQRITPTKLVSDIKNMYSICYVLRTLSV